MSASSKKKLRNEQKAAKMTEKQLAEQKEAKKLKLYSTIFVVVVAAFLVIAIFVGVNQVIANSGVREKNTVALTVGDHEISNAQLSYYYIDAINNFYSTYGSYAGLFGLDVTKPLNEQYLDEEAGLTWADDFLSSAKDSVISVYAMVDAANAAGYTATEEELAQVDIAVSNMELYASIYGYADTDAYLKAMYGNGASVEGFREYMEVSILADSYYNAYNETLTYEDAELRAAEQDNYNAYSSYSYNYYYLSADKFLEGGTTDEDGNTTYSDEETAASVAAAEEAAKLLTAEEIDSVDAFNAAIAGLSINAETEAESMVYENYTYDSISELLRDWITDASRVEGDMTYIENFTTSTDEDGNEIKDINGYYVLYWLGYNDNTFAMKNVRHILVSFEHDHAESEDHDHSSTDYTDEEKAAAYAAAEEILNQWKSGDATEESFAALANEMSDDGDGTTGGLYENIYPGQMVESFEDWCYDEARVVGETGIIESTYGYHIMYFVGDSDLTYRDYMITNELKEADLTAWYNSAVESIPVTEGNTDYISKDLVLSAA